MRKEFLWGSALSLVALSGSLFCLHGCSGRKTADINIVSKKDTLAAAMTLAESRAEVVADAGGNAAAAATKDSSFVIRLATTELENGAKLSGSVAGKFTADLYRLLWVDGSRRVLGAYELHSVKKEKNTDAVLFDIPRPPGILNSKQKLLLISATNDENLREKAQPLFRIEGEIEFSVTAPAAANNDYLVQFEPLIPVASQPLCLPGKWDDFRAAFARSRDEKLLLRQPSIFDETALGKAKRAIVAGVNKDQTRVLLGEGLSLTQGASPFDFDMSPETLDVFRGWLEERYGSVQSVNLQWGTQFADWHAVVPLATDAMRGALNSRYAERLAALKAGGEKKWEERGGVPGFQMESSELHEPGNENFSAWSDFREFSSFAFARIIREYRTQLKDVSPNSRAGLGGICSPSPWGWDLWQLSRSVDFTYGHESILVRELMRSFAPAAPAFSQINSKTENARGRLWDGWLRGDSGAVINGVNENAALIADVSQMADLTALRQMAQPAGDAIAIYYSPRSMQVHWMLDSEADGSFWLNRDGAYEAAHSSALLQLNAWLMLLEDLGYAPHFVHPSQVTGGQLLKSKTKVVILPKVLALSNQEADALSEFAKAGGVIIADGQCGTFDEHGKRRQPQTSTLGKGMTRKDVPRPIGILDSFFGIVRKDLNALELNGDFNGDESTRVTLKDPISGERIGPDSDELRILEPGVVSNGGWNNAAAASGAAALISKSGGMGRFIYLNLSMQDYAQRRLENADGFKFQGLSEADYIKLYGTPRGGEALRLIVGDMLSEVLAENPLRVLGEDGTPLRGIKRARFVLGKDSAIFGLLPLGGIAVKAETPVWAAQSKNKHWYDVRQGKYLGGGTSAACTLQPDCATVLAALPYKVERLGLKVRRTDPRGGFKISGALIADVGHFSRHLVRLEVADPEGKTIAAYTRDIATDDGAFSAEIMLGLNDAAGRYRLLARDLLTGVSAEQELLKDISEYGKLLP